VLGGEYNVKKGLEPFEIPGVFVLGKVGKIRASRQLKTASGIYNGY
jgi:hypothetical protein